MDKVSRINVEGRDYEVLSGGAVRGASASLANDWTKTVVLPQGAEPLDGIFLVVTFVYGNSVGTPKPQTVYSADGETFYADEGLTVPVTLPDPQNYSVTLVSGEEYSLQTYPVLNVNSTIFPVCNAKGYLCGGDKLWSPGDKVVILISDGYAQIMSAGISGSGITIYESLDAILEDLPNLSVGDVLATFSEKDIKTGVPLGTWTSFANDSAPNGEWLQAGTTFNENTYPALAMMLGNNVVPERYAPQGEAKVFMDINNPNSNVSLANKEIKNASHVTTLEVVGMTRTNQQDIAKLRVDLTTATSLIFGFGGSEYTLTLNGTYNSVNNIWTITSVSGNVRGLYVYYDESVLTAERHPMFIKATPTSSDTDYEGTLNAIRNFTANAESYSTEEKWTGGYWIDGKKIYRTVFKIWENGAIVSGFSLSGQIFTKTNGNITYNAERIITFKGVITETNNHQSEQGGSVPSQGYGSFWISDNSFYSNVGVTCKDIWIIAEYTKTTED